MLWSIRYRLLCWLLRLLVGCGLDELDLETVVLRHQLKVLRRGGGRVLVTTVDRAFLAAAARVLSRAQVELLPGRPGHAGKVAPGPPAEKRRAWLAAAHRLARSPDRDLILRLARENPRWATSGSEESS